MLPSRGFCDGSARKPKASSTPDSSQPPARKIRGVCGTLVPAAGRSMQSTSHPDLARLTAFARGLLAGVDAAAIEAHLLECLACADRLVSNEPADKLVDGVRSVLADSAWRSWGVPPLPPGLPATPGTLLAGRYRLLEPIAEGG